MEGNTTNTLAEGLTNIHQLIKVWQKIKPEAQDKLKLVIDDKISLLRECAMPKTSSDNEDAYSKYPLLGVFIGLAEQLSETGYQTDAVDNAVMEEVEAMVAKLGIGTPAATKAGDATPTVEDSAVTSFPLRFFGNNGCGWVSNKDGIEKFSLVFSEDTKHYAVVPAKGFYPSPILKFCFEIYPELVDTVSYRRQDSAIWIKNKSAGMSCSILEDFLLLFPSPGNADTYLEHLMERPRSGQIQVQLLTRKGMEDRHRLNIGSVDYWP